MSPRPPSRRQLRVGQAIRRVVADFLVQGAGHDPRLDPRRVMVRDVEIGPDLRLATIFVSLNLPADSGETLEALARARGRFRAQIARRLRLKFTPDLRFRTDERTPRPGGLEAPPS